MAFWIPALLSLAGTAASMYAGSQKKTSSVEAQGGPMDAARANMIHQIAPFLVGMTEQLKGFTKPGSNRQRATAEQMMQSTLAMAGKKGITPGSASLMGSLPQYTQAMASPDASKYMKGLGAAQALYGVAPNVGGSITATGPGAGLMDYASLGVGGLAALMKMYDVFNQPNYENKAFTNETSFDELKKQYPGLNFPE